MRCSNSQTASGAGQGQGSLYRADAGSFQLSHAYGWDGLEVCVGIFRIASDIYVRTIAGQQPVSIVIPLKWKKGIKFIKQKRKCF